MPLLINDQVDEQLKTVPEWTKRVKTIFRTFHFKSFLKSIEFVQRVAQLAEAANHHPDINIRYEKVTLALTSHDVGGISRRDFTLAQQCDELFSRDFSD